MVLNIVLLKALPIFMDTIMPPWAAILLSATLVLAFVEVKFVLPIAVDY